MYCHYIAMRMRTVLKNKLLKYTHQWRRVYMITNSSSRYSYNDYQRSI